MCGIAGFVGSFDEELLGRMSQAMAHRGPDDFGSWVSHRDGVGLATRRLSIIDLSPRGHQPMIDVSERAVISFNGEIFNYRELRHELESSGLAFRSDSDTEVVLNLYLRDGVGMLNRLNGMFAFAIWDLRNRTMFLARDSVGVKPLYYAETSLGFMFASEMKSLLQSPDVPRDIDPLAVQHYLAYIYCPAPRTMLRAVSKLEPGHAMILREGRVQRKWQYYDLPYAEHHDEMLEDDAVVEVREALTRAVERQMIADVPVGAFLSGGLDSSAIVALARRLTRESRLQCFTIGFRDDAVQREGFADDLPYARQVATALEVDLHVVEVGPEMAGQFETMIYHLDEPQADPAALNVFFICQLARECGIKVLLSGAGGDDILAGYRRHRAVMAERYWSWLPPAARGALAWSAGKMPTRSPSLRRLSKAFRNADSDSDERLAAYFLWGTTEVRQSLYGPWLREGLLGAMDTRPLVDTLAALPPETPPLQKMLYLEGKHFLPDHNLNYTDKMSMACGVEVRVPFLDPDLIALAASLQPDLKQKGNVGKWVLKKAMEPLLPQEVIYRPKTGFGAPVRQWITKELRPLVDDVLSVNAVSRRGLFDPNGVRRLVSMDREGRIDGSYTVLSLLCIESWCRQFIDSPVPSIPVGSVTINIGR
jgi:asparagine synthase (glutamine-hydrolysing)